jgi:hypothetical protein
MQQHRYEKNQYYRPHHDYFSDTVSYIPVYFHYYRFIVRWESPQLASINHLQPFVPFFFETVQLEAWWTANSYNAYVFR